MNDVFYIADHRNLVKMCQQLQHDSWLAIDTEFTREKTYFPEIALVQIANNKYIYCIDPLALDDLSPLYELLRNSEITKVFHAAGQDLEIFFHQCQFIPQPLFDTQVAASLLGLGEQIGYATLVKKLLDIELDKSHSRTDWQQRPLLEEQIRYAADDVRYLSRLYPDMRQRLEKLDRLEWMVNEQARLLDTATYQSDPDGSWQRIKGHGKLRRKQLNTLKHLAAWRERLAVRQNLPRRWILTDDALLSLAIKQPTDTTQLQQIRALNGKKTERYAKDWLKLIKQAGEEDESQWPTVPHPKKPSTAEDATVDMLMAIVRIRADEHQLSPGQITSRSELLRLVRGERDLALLNGWRRKIAGETMIDACAGKIQLACRKGHTVLNSL